MEKIIFNEIEADRLDKYLARIYPEKSRSIWQKTIKEGNVKVNGKKVSPHFQLSDKDEIKLLIANKKTEPNTIKSVNIPLEIVYEDKDMMVINKQASLTVHPINENDDTPTLVNALLNHTSSLSDYGGKHKLGIVHRLDKDTSGLMIIAKTNEAHKNLVKQISRHEVKKHYLALIQGHLKPGQGAIEAPITRDCANRTKMNISSNKNAKYALSNYQVIEYFDNKTTLVDIEIITGRTHQIRVHFSSIGFPVIGDQKYGRKTINKIFFDKFNLQRQFLHAYKLDFNHPITNEKIVFESDLPKDLKYIISNLQP